MHFTDHDPKGSSAPTGRLPTEIEITPEMIEAALPHLYRYHPESGVSEEETVRQILLAALAAKQSGPEGP